MEKVNEVEPLMNASRVLINDVKTGGAVDFRDEPVGRLHIAQAASGVEAARVPFWRLCATTGTTVWNAKRKGTRRENVEAESIKVRRWDGLGCRSDEGWQCGWSKEPRSIRRQGHSTGNRRRWL